MNRGVLLLGSISVTQQTLNLLFKKTELHILRPTKAVLIHLPAGENQSSFGPL